MIIDFHTHIFPDHMAAKTMIAMRKRAGVTCYIDGTVDGLLQSMQEAGIGLSVVSRITTKSEQVEPVNQWIRSIMEARICPLATMHPDVSAKADLTKALKAQGFKGFKLHPDYQGFFVDDNRMYPFYEAAQEEGMPILFHAGLDRGLPPPLHSTPERLAKLHRLFPHLIMIAAHMGGEDIYEETERYLLGSDIYLDTSFVLSIMPVSTIKRFIKKHPIERFIFGTDSPWADQGKELNFLLSLPFLTDDEKEKMAGANAARLLRL